MCGIAGIVEFDSGGSVTERQLRSMLGTLRHRGPDQFGIYLGEEVGLGNARLSIIDLGGGQQPISNEDGTLWIIFNGEIFNYVELRAELEARGHCFSTHTDTEVIVHAYEEYGRECVSHFNGQFAFAIWNEQERSIFVARDRLGVRPLFYAQKGNRLLFASEIKAILATNEISASIDPVALDQIFTYWSTITPRTAFQGVLELPAGHYLFARQGRTEVKPYWSVRFPAREEERSNRPDAEYVEELRELLTDATRIRLRADVPVGAYLSGGLDSCVLAGITRRLGVGRLETFSISFNDANFDESQFQLRMAKFLGTDHHVVEATHEDIGNAFPEVVWNTETPVLRTAPAPMFLLSKLVREKNVKVVLSGEGADEILAGYDIFKESKVRRFWARQPQSKWRSALLRRLYPDIGALGNAGSAYLAAFFGPGMMDLDSPDYSHAVRWRNTRRCRRFFSERLASAIQSKEAESMEPIEYPQEFSTWGDLQKAQYLEATVFLSQYLLSSQGDRMAMAHSVEGRHPFLDYRVVEFCNRLPSRCKLRGLKDKFILRRLAEAYVPKEIFSRPKRPYRAPIHRSFFHKNTDRYVEESLAPENVERLGYFKPPAVAQLAAKLKKGVHVGETDDMALVGILSTHLVHERFVANFRADNPLNDRDDVKVVCAQSVAS